MEGGWKRGKKEGGCCGVSWAAGAGGEPIVGVVGALQFDVITSRLRTEYGVSVEIEPAGYAVARWLGGPVGRMPALGAQSAVAADRQERRVLLFGSEWELQYFQRHHPDVPLLAESPVA